MSGIADVALWAALVLTGLVSGILWSRWYAPAAGRPDDLALMIAAGAAVVAWSARAGTLLGAGPQPALFTTLVPTDVAAGYRLAVLWATLPGAALSLGAAFATSAALAPIPRGRSRQSALLAGASVAALAVAVWFTPTSGAGGGSALSLPPFVQAPSAAIAPLLALAALGGLCWLVTWWLTASPGVPVPRRMLHLTWIASTAAVAAEQVARSQLGIGPRDGVVLGTASSGLVFWLAISALLHERVQGLLGRGERGVERGAQRRLGVNLAHAGAICLVLSFAAHIGARRSTLQLPPGQSIEARGSLGGSWRLVNQGISRFDAEGVDVTALAIEATNPTGRSRLVTPELRDFHTRDGGHVETPVGLRRSVRGLTEELRVLLEATDSVDVARVRVTFLPVPVLWPAGLLLVAASVLLLAMGSRAGAGNPRL